MSRESGTFMKRIETRRDEVVENYHGTPVADPYRWLENATSEETQAWVEAQHEVSSAYFHMVEDRPRITARLKELLDFPRYSVPTRRAERYFFSHNTGLQNQAALYMQESLEGLPFLFKGANAREVTNSFHYKIILRCETCPP